MTNNARIYNRFDGYSTEDCRCEWCLHPGGKDRPCLLDECCCMEADEGDKTRTRG